MNQKQTKFFLGSMIVVLAIGYLIFTGISKTAVYYLTVSELLSRGKEIYNEGVRIQGKVVPGSIKKKEGTLKVDFRISDDSQAISVTYEGVVPDLFEDNREVVVEGLYTAEGIFKASTLLTSCPSKYEAENPDIAQRG